MKKNFYYPPVPPIKGSKYDVQLIITAVFVAFGIALAIAWAVIFLVMP